LDWRVVEETGEWRLVCEALNGASAPSVQGKWEEMFGVKDEVKKEKNPVKKRSVRKKTAGEKKKTSRKPKAKNKAD
jgi:hypothetical protein